MNINWKLRFKNKTTLVALVTAVVAFVYQLLGIFGITAPISQETVIQVLGVLINLLVALGIVVDPTTQGISDSVKANGYSKPANTTESEAVSNMVSEMPTSQEDLNAEIRNGFPQGGEK